MHANDSSIAALDRGGFPTELLGAMVRDESHSRGGGLTLRTVIETAALVRSGEMKATDTLDETLRSIDADNPELNAFVHPRPDGPSPRPRASTTWWRAATTLGRSPACPSA